MTDAIRNDKFSTPQTRTGHKNDGIHPRNNDAAQSEIQSSTINRGRNDVEIERANTLFSQQSINSGMSSNIRDPDQASKISATLVTAIQNDPQGALGAYSALRADAAEATLAAPSQ